uniref:Single-pass membrane and coiled-coil domain-containing protein 4 n=1 Tax=Neovison vison TaxID=452646 RepID=A0A8C7AF87_NEOVI
YWDPCTNTLPSSFSLWFEKSCADSCCVRHFFPGLLSRITQVTFTGSQFAESTETAVLKVEEKKVQCLDQRSVALPSKASPDAPSQHCPGKMRQLKGKPKKETSKDKKERKQAMQEARQQITTVVLPTLAVVVLLIVVFVYVATRPTITE